MTSAPEPPSDPWALPSTPHAGPAPITPYLSLPQADPQQPAVAPSVAMAQPGPVILHIGEIAVTSTLVRTPAGDIPLSGSTWQVGDYWHNEQKIPTWAIVTAVVGFCFIAFFSLLFLLAKETIYRGTAQITVTNGPQHYVARIPITDQAQLAHLHQQVNYVRSLAAL